MNQYKYGFVYIWYDRKHKRYYIGCHWGNEDDGYICSSRWMRKAFRRRPEDFKRRILSRVSDRSGMFEEEFKWLSLISKEDLGKRYYNLKVNSPNHWSTKDKERTRIRQAIIDTWELKSPKEERYVALNKDSEELKQLHRENTTRMWAERTEEQRSAIITRLHEAENPRRKGHKSSPDHVAKIVAANTGKKRTQEHCHKLRLAKLGSKQSEETKLKRSLALKGKPRSEETKRKISEGHKRRLAVG